MYFRGLASTARQGCAIVTYYELDTLVLVAGFQADRFIRPSRVLGEGGFSLDRLWERRPAVYYAVTFSGFPNFFMLDGATGRSAISR